MNALRGVGASGIEALSPSGEEEMHLCGHAVVDVGLKRRRTGQPQLDPLGRDSPSISTWSVSST